MQQTAGPSPKTGAFAHPMRNVDALAISSGMTVADFGAGSGAYVSLIAEKLEGFGRVYAIDIQRDLLRRIGNDAAKRGFSNVELLWGDLEQPGGSKLADASLDLVLISNLLFQLADKEVVLHEARRVIRPRGRVVIIDWLESFGGIGPQKKDVVTKEHALELAHAANLELMKEFDAGAHHYGLILRASV
jgi:ubiquinone/menaquinone biosynthesis C-methylase UbiE